MIVSHNGDDDNDQRNLQRATKKLKNDQPSGTEFWDLTIAVEKLRGY
jgi:hypothetical protein